MIDDSDGVLQVASPREHYDFLYNPNPAVSKHWAPLMIRTPDKSHKEVIGNWTSSVLVVWTVDGPIMTILGSQILTKRISVNKLMKQFPLAVHSKDVLSDKLIEIYTKLPETYRMTPEVIPKAPTNVITTYDTESLGQQILMKTLADNYKLTNEGCLADGVYISNDFDQVLPIQVKTSRKVEKSGHFHFCMKKSYPNLLVIAIALTLDLIFVIPGALVPSKALGGSPKGKYKKYIVKTSQLRSLLTNVCTGLQEGRQSVSWPSGTEVPITTINMLPETLAMIPQSLMQQKEHHAMLYRSNRLSDLQYTRPTSENGSVDWYIEGTAVQDKVSRWNKSRYEAALTRANKDGRYRAGDFEALWIHCGPDVFCLIPAQELSNRGYFKTDTMPGKIHISIYLPDSDSSGLVHTWTKDYILSYSNPKLVEIVKHRLSACKEGSHL